MPLHFAVLSVTSLTPIFPFNPYNTILNCCPQNLRLQKLDYVVVKQIKMSQIIKRQVYPLELWHANEPQILVKRFPQMQTYVGYLTTKYKFKKLKKKKLATNRGQGAVGLTPPSKRFQGVFGAHD